MCRQKPRSLASLGMTSVHGNEYFRDKTHRAILRLQGLDALGNIAIIDVAAVNLHEVLEGRGSVTGRFIGCGQLIVESRPGFFVNARGIEGFLVPANSGLRNAFVEKALCQPSISLHGLREGMSAINSLAGLLQFANSFVEQTHFAERDAEIVVSLGIFFSGGGAGFEILLQLSKHFREVNPGVLRKGRGLGCCGGRNGRRDLGRRG